MYLFQVSRLFSRSTAEAEKREANPRGLEQTTGLRRHFNTTGIISIVKLVVRTEHARVFYFHLWRNCCQEGCATMHISFYLTLQTALLATAALGRPSEISSRMNHRLMKRHFWCNGGKKTTTPFQSTQAANPHTSGLRNHLPRRPNHGPNRRLRLQRHRHRRPHKPNLIPRQRRNEHHMSATATPTGRKPSIEFSSPAAATPIKSTHRFRKSGIHILRQ